MNFDSIDILSEEEINKQYDDTLEMNEQQMSWIYFKVYCYGYGRRGYFYEPYYYNYMCTGCCDNETQYSATSVQYPIGNVCGKGIPGQQCVESQGQ